VKTPIYQIFVIFILIVIYSCQKSTEFDFERTIIKINNQQFEVLTAWQIFDEYIKKGTDYNSSIFLKIKDEFDNNAEFSALIDLLKQDVKPDEALIEEIHLMKRIDFVKIVDTVYQKVAKELPGPDTKILFIPANPAYRNIYKQYGFGLHAITPGTGRIIVSFDPTFENWRQILPYTLAHEYHHSVWTSRNFETAELTPLEYIILEGKADAFAYEIYPVADHPFINKLDNVVEKNIWNTIKPEMNKRNTGINDKLFNGSGDIPVGSVYSIGFNILKSFKTNNPEIAGTELIDLSAREVLYMSRTGGSSAATLGLVILIEYFYEI